jgi:hypothetical protein
MPTGSCLCGVVRWEVTAPYEWMGHCHCSMCRKHHVSLFASNFGVAPEKFRWLQGQDAVAGYRSSQGFERAFCRHCGSVLPDTSTPVVICPAGSLPDLDMKPQVHIFFASRSPSYECNDELPRFDEYPPGFGTPVSGKSRGALKEGVVEGSCLCGEVAFEFDEVPTKMVNCHCSRCRISRGAAHGTNVFSRAENLRWVRGAERVKTYKVPDAMMFGTAFCERCGSKLPALFEKINRYLVPVGVLDTTLALKPRVNVHVASKAAWFDIADSLPRFDTMPPRERAGEFFY